MGTPLSRHGTALKKIMHAQKNIRNQNITLNYQYSILSPPDLTESVHVGTSLVLLSVRGHHTITLLQKVLSVWGHHTITLLQKVLTIWGHHTITLLQKVLSGVTIP